MKYHTTKYCLAISDTVFLIILLILFQYFGFSYFFKARIESLFSNSILLIGVYILAVYIIYYILNFPSNYLSSFALEHKFNLTNQKFSDWMKDQVKTFIISYIIFLILAEAFYFILDLSPHYWWLITALFWIFFSIILARLTPTLLIPIFFKYKALSDETLKARIINLADKMNVKILDVFEIDFSKKTLKANAAFTGMGKTKRVILADTLKDKYSYDEIEVILAHEFAHYRLKHIWQLILINSLLTLVSFYLISLASRYIYPINIISALPVLVLYLVLFGIITTPLNNALSCKFERDADKMAIEFTGNREAFISTMEKLANQNLADRKPHPIIKFFFFDHPPIDERIDMARKST